LLPVFVTHAFQPIFTGISSFFLKSDQKITLVEGLGPFRALC
jgi:hypothetical protein